MYITYVVTCPVKKMHCMFLSRRELNDILKPKNDVYKVYKAIQEIRVLIINDAQLVNEKIPVCCN